MSALIGIRREDKSRWERRTPLIPTDLAALQQKHGLRFLVQSSDLRIYSDGDYRSAGIAIGDNLDPASIIFAVKEVPADLILPEKVYIFFAHVIKGQSANMPMLKRLMDQGCSLVDYERITDHQGRRLIFFGRHAGYAGMIDTLRCLGQRLALTGVLTPLAKVRPAYEYEDLEAARKHLRSLRAEFDDPEMRASALQLVIGFSGYGNVSAGAQDIYECLEPTPVEPADLPSVASRPPAAGCELIKAVFREEHLAVSRDPGKPFDLAEYYRHPERYRGCFQTHLPYLDVLVNAIYWEPRYPRLVTRKWCSENYLPGSPARLKVIGDISCDIEGSIEPTVRATEPDNPCYVYLPQEGETRDGFQGDGPVILAVDNLPCEIAKESSQHFSSSLRDSVGALACAGWHLSYEDLDLPSALKRAVIVHKGELTADYRYLHEHLEVHPQGAAGS